MGAVGVFISGIVDVIAAEARPDPFVDKQADVAQLLQALCVGDLSSSRNAAHHDDRRLCDVVHGITMPEASRPSRRMLVRARSREAPPGTGMFSSTVTQAGLRLVHHRGRRFDELDPPAGICRPYGRQCDDVGYRRVKARGLQRLLQDLRYGLEPAGYRLQPPPDSAAHGHHLNRDSHEAGFPRPKTLADFDFAANTAISPATINTLAGCGWVSKGQSLCLIGDSGTGKSHLLIGLGTAAAQAGHKVRYMLAAKLVNELVEAANERQLSRTIARYGRVELLCLDELGYMELDKRGAELLFQVLTEREEKTAVAIASNDSFSGWTKTFTDPRLCAAIVDRLTFGGNIIETGTSSYRLAHARNKRTANA